MTGSAWSGAACRRRRVGQLVPVRFMGAPPTASCAPNAPTSTPAALPTAGGFGSSALLGPHRRSSTDAARREQMVIPAGELQRFGAEICPRLRHIAAVVSSDGSFVAPEIGGPALVFNARYGAGHSVKVAWEWEYQVGDAVRRAPLATTGPVMVFVTAAPSARCSPGPSSPMRTSWSAMACWAPPADRRARRRSS